MFSDFTFVMAGLVPAIHVLLRSMKEGVDARPRPGMTAEISV